MRAVVVGGGLAGITAALALAGQGAEVTLLEAKPRLGGATMSFDRDGLTVDTGQHVFLRCCTHYRGLLDRLGIAGRAPLQARFDVTVLSPADGSGRPPSRLRRNRLPAPLHLLPTLLSYRQLSLAERARVGQAALALRGVDPDDPATDQVRFGDWLARHGQDERTRRVLWDLFSVASINVPGDDASLAIAAKVVRTGLLGDAGAADIGVPALPLGELHGDAATRKLAELGATVRLGTKVAAIEPGGAGEGAAGDGARFTIRLGRGRDEDIAADAVVLAVPHEAAARLIPPGALPAPVVAGWAGLGYAPIVNVHVIYDREVMEVPLAAGVDSPVQWVFDRTAISGLSRRDPTAQYLAISLSAADDYVDRSVASLREEFVPALAALLPAARAATVTEFFVTRERHATFRGVAGTARLRPAAATGLPGLVLAGSWTATGWPDTMEGAVRSGLSAVVALRTGMRVTAAGATGTVETVTEVYEVDNSTVSTADEARGVRP
ncbi:MAG TPA: hydroxysqualene dehydroxylase HpnE [Trebonia sp.]|jgi:squalene-associated FAD-dependent desaturase|nr:hydroxysqualene dehydroxylase HpnE [Trebonia sp.]